jgi:RNA 3'-terminal phosphate cyclase
VPPGHPGESPSGKWTNAVIRIDGSMGEGGGQVVPESYRFVVGTAGSATLVLQTVLPALVMASGPSELTLEGGTHNPWAPPFDFLERYLDADVPVDQGRWDVRATRDGRKL